MKGRGEEVSKCLGFHDPSSTLRKGYNWCPWM